jgi:hypothetical protein
MAGIDEGLTPESGLSDAQAQARSLADESTFQPCCCTKARMGCNTASASSLWFWSSVARLSAGPANFDSG